MIGEEDKLRLAVRQVRKATGLDQTNFAAKIGKSFQMIRKYETETPPRGAALAVFVLLAEELGLDEPARLFRKTMIADLGPEVIRALSSKSRADETAADAGGVSMWVPADMSGLVDWMLDLFAKEGTLEQELLKQTLRELGHKRSAVTHPQKRRNAS